MRPENVGALYETNLGSKDSHYESSTKRQIRAPAWIIISALAAGAILASFPPAEQDAVEGSLVLAGLAAYPPGSAMGLYFFGTWTLLHQLGAGLLLLGIPQQALEYLFALTPMALRCGGYAMLIYGFSRKPLFSLIAAAICYASGFLLPFFSSPDYPVAGRLGVPDQYTFGVFAYGMAAWIIGALAGGRPVLAGFSAAILISMHPFIGSYMTAILAATIILNRLLKADLPSRGILRGFAFGVPITAASFVAFLAMRPSMVPTDPVAYAAYLKYWDGHRSLDFEPRVVIAAAVAVVALTMFILLARKQRSAAVLGSLAILISVIISACLYAVVHLWPEWLPRALVAAMPGRLPSITASVAGATAVGMATWLFGLVSSALHKSGDAATSAKTSFRSDWLSRGLRLAVLLVALLAPGTFSKDLQTARDAMIDGRYRIGHTDEFWRAVREAKIKGPVLCSYDASTPALHQGHLWVLLNTRSINFVPYVPAAVHQIARIITDAYGMSFTNPPPRARELIMDEQGYWSRLGPEQWHALKNEFGIVGVIAPSSSKLKLPVRLAGRQFTLYDIPSENSAPSQ